MTTLEGVLTVGFSAGTRSGSFASLRMTGAGRLWSQMIKARWCYSSRGASSSWRSEGFHGNAAAVGKHVFRPIEGAKQGQLGGGVLFGNCSASGECTLDPLVPGQSGAQNTLTAKVVLRSEVTSNTYSVAGASGAESQGGTATDKVVLIDVSRLGGVGLHAAQGHGKSLVLRFLVSPFLGLVLLLSSKFQLLTADF